MERRKKHNKVAIIKATKKKSENTDKAQIPPTEFVLLVKKKGSEIELMGGQ